MGESRDQNRRVGKGEASVQEGRSAQGEEKRVCREGRSMQKKEKCAGRGESSIEEKEKRVCGERRERAGKG